MNEKRGRGSKPRQYKSPLDQSLFSFDLQPKVEAINHVDAPKVVKKLLRALVRWGCTHDADVTLGGGGPDGEWLLAPKREQICELEGIDLATWKRWLNAPEVLESDYLWVKRWKNKETEFVLYFSALFADADIVRHLRSRNCAGAKCAGAISESPKNAPAHFAPAQSAPAHFSDAPDIPREGRSMGDLSLKPTKETKSLNTTTHTTKAKEEGSSLEGESPKRRKSLGISIVPWMLRTGEGNWKIFRAAVSVGLLTEEDAEHCFAFLIWANRQKDRKTDRVETSNVDDKCALAAGLLLSGREHWGLRAEPKDYELARAAVAHMRGQQK